MKINNLRILAIDDIADNLITLKAVISQVLPDSNVFTALNGIDGIKIAKKEKRNLKAINENQTQFYGWYPFWMHDAYQNYNFNSLTTVSFFSVDAYLDDFNQVSFIENGINEKFASDLFKKAKSAGCRIDLTFKCDDKEVIDLLLNNDSVRNKCINYLTYLLDTSSLMTDGIALVFENLPANNSGSLVLFIAQLKQSIKKSNRSIKLALPESDLAKNYEILKLNKLVDNYLLIGIFHIFQAWKSSLFHSRISPIICHNQLCPSLLCLLL